MARPKKYPVELIQRGIRLALESERPIVHIAADLGMHPETLRKKVRQAEADSTLPSPPRSAEICSPVPLRAVLLLRHADEGIRIEPAPPAQAVRDLSALSFRVPTATTVRAASQL